MQEQEGDEGRETPNGQVDVETPSPGDLGQRSAQDRSDDAGNTKGGYERPLPDCSLAQRYDGRDDNQTSCKYARRAKSRDSSSDNKCLGRRCEGADETSQLEDSHGGKVDYLLWEQNVGFPCQGLTRTTESIRDDGRPSSERETNSAR